MHSAIAFCAISSKFIIFTLFVVVIFCRNVYGIEQNTDFFSSVCGLESLLQTETTIVRELQHYVDMLSTHTEALQREIDAIKWEHLAAASDPEGYLNNPVNAFRLIKRLHNDWAAYEDHILNENSSKTYLKVMQSHRQNFNFPTQEDVFGSVMALVRLQSTYKLKVSDVASGILNGVKYGNEMSWADCFALGHVLFENKVFNHSISWLKLAMEKLKRLHEVTDHSTLDFIETVASYHHQMGDFKTAVDLINYVMAADSSRQHLYNTQVELTQLIRDNVKSGIFHETLTDSQDYHNSNEFQMYEKVCREELTLTSSQQNQLHCKYVTNNVPYRILQPYKLEIRYLDPLIIQIHDIINDNDIERIKNMAKPEMTRSKVRATNETFATSITTYRTSKSAWFPYDFNVALKKMSLHFEDLSGLNMKYAEDLQVANYGIGGHYEPHWDFFTDDEAVDPLTGNRVATGIFYLSNVDEGGATAFLFLRVLIKPEKGSLLMWYNLHASEDRDYRTKHAACPVLKGSKWIANIWVRIRGQDRERPCDLQPEDLHLMYRDFD